MRARSHWLNAVVIMLAWAAGGALGSARAETPAPRPLPLIDLGKPPVCAAVRRCAQMCSPEVPEACDRLAVLLEPAFASRRFDPRGYEFYDRDLGGVDPELTLICERAAGRERISACVLRGRLRSWRGDDAGARAALDPLCARGELDACAAAADVAYGGVRGRPDVIAAVAAYRAGCAKNHGPSCLGLAIATLEGRGVTASPSDAEPLFDKACAAGPGWVCEQAGLLHNEDPGVEPKAEHAAAYSGARAAHFFEAACQKGHAFGCYLHGAFQAAGAARLAAFRKACVLGEEIGCGQGAQEAGIAHDPALRASLLLRQCRLGGGYALEGCAGLPTEPLWQIRALRAVCEREGSVDCPRALIAEAEQKDKKALDRLVALCADKEVDAPVRSAACTGLADLYASGRGVASDLGRAVGYAEAACALDSKRCDGARHARQLLTDVAACEDGDAASCANAAKEDLLRDRGHALTMLDGACKKGVAYGCVLAVTDRQQHQEPITKDALEVVAKHCDGGDLGSCVLAGNTFGDPASPYGDTQRSVLMFARACELKRVDACVLLGRAYRDPPTSDRATAKRFLDAACALSAADAPICKEAEALK